MHRRSSVAASCVAVLGIGRTAAAQTPLPPTPPPGTLTIAAPALPPAVGAFTPRETCIQADPLLGTYYRYGPGARRRPARPRRSRAIRLTRCKSAGDVSRGTWSPRTRASARTRPSAPRTSTASAPVTSACSSTSSARAGRGGADEAAERARVEEFVDEAVRAVAAAWRLEAGPP